MLSRAGSSERSNSSKKSRAPEEAYINTTHAHTHIHLPIHEWSNIYVCKCGSFIFLRCSSLPRYSITWPTQKKQTCLMLKNTVTIKKQHLPLTKFLHKIYSPVEPRSVPPPSSILDQFGVDFPLEPPSATTSRLSVDIGEWRLPTNLVNECRITKSFSNSIQIFFFFSNSAFFDS